MSSFACRFVAVSAVLVTTLLAATGAQAARLDCTTVDDFSRPQSTDLGSMWNEAFGSGLSIDSAGNAVNVDLGVDGLMTFVPAQAESACISVTSHTTSVQYVALVLEYRGTDENVFVKVQNNGGTADFDTVYFYYGNNGDPFANAVLLSAPFPEADLELRPSGDTVQLLIDTNSDRNSDEIITADAPIPASASTTAGLGIYGPASADYFGIVPIPPATRITHRPKRRVVTSERTKRLKFKFDSPAPVHTFSCRLDGSPFSPCTSPYVVGKASAGRHTFEVRAVDGLGNPDESPARAKVRVVRR